MADSPEDPSADPQSTSGIKKGSGKREEVVDFTVVDKETKDEYQTRDQTTDISDPRSDQTTDISDQTTDISDPRSDQTTDISDQTTDRISDPRSDQTTDISDPRSDQTTDISDQTTDISNPRSDQTTDISDPRSDQTTDISDPRSDQTTDISGQASSRRITQEDPIAKLFVFHQQKWNPPNIKIKACNRHVIFHVVINLSVWNIKPGDQFTLSVYSPEINNGESFYGNFMCCSQLKNLCLYKCQLPILPQFLIEGVFRYEYVVMCNKGEGSIKYETLKMYHSHWRIVEPNIAYQHDAEIKPAYPGLLSKTTELLYPPSASKFATNALSVYIDWSIKQRWLYVDTLDIEKEIVNKANRLSYIIKTLKWPHHFRRSSFIFNDSETTNSVDTEVLKQLVYFLFQHSYGMSRFLSSLIVAVIFLLTGFFKNPSNILKENVDLARDFLITLQVPPHELEDCSKVLLTFSPQFRNSRIKLVTVNFCNSLISSYLTSHEWMGVLPLLHIITLNEFVIGKPYQLPLTEKEVNDVLFCGIDPTLLTDSREAYSFIAPYFESDWLMPRAFIAVCSSEGIFLHIQDYPEIAPFACWKLGMLAKRFGGDFDEDFLIGLAKVLKSKPILEEDYSLCYKGVHELLHVCLLFDQIFPELVRIMLIVLEKSLSLPKWEPHLNYCIQTLSIQVLDWMKNYYGPRPQPSHIIKELKDWSDMYSIGMNERLKNEWKKSLKLSERLNQIDVKQKVTLIQSIENLHPEVMNKLLNSVLESVKDSEDCEVLSSLKSNITNTKNIKIIGAILSLKYSNKVDVQFTFLFTNFWATILELYYRAISMAPNPSVYREEQFARTMCERAKRKLTQFFTNVTTRQITPSELDDIISVGELSETLKTVELFLSLEIFKNLTLTTDDLQKEIEAYKSFKLNRKMYHFAHTFTQLAEDETIQNEYQSQYAKTPIGNLWEYNDSAIVYILCPTDLPSDVIQEYTHKNKQGQFKWSIDYFSKEQIFEVFHYGVKVLIPPLAVLHGEQCIDLTVQVMDEQDHHIPDGYTPVSCFYKVKSSRNFAKPIELFLQHNWSNKDLIFLTCRDDFTFQVFPPKEFIGNNGVLQLMDTSQSVIVALAAFVKATIVQRSYAMLLVYKQVLATLWKVKIIVTQNLGPYLERIKGDDSVKSWKQQDFYSFKATSQCQLNLKSWNSDNFEIKLETEPGQISMCDVDSSQKDSTLVYLSFQVTQINEELNDLQLILNINDKEDFTRTIFSSDLQVGTEKGGTDPQSDPQSIAQSQPVLSMTISPEEETFLSRKRPNEANLMQVLNKINSKWKLIGMALNVNDNDRDAIFQKHQNVTCCLNDVLVIWMNKSINVTWLTIINAVRNQPVNNVEVAKEIKEFALRIKADTERLKNNGETSSQPAELQSPLPLPSLVTESVSLYQQPFISSSPFPPSPSISSDIDWSYHLELLKEVKDKDDEIERLEEENKLLKSKLKEAEERLRRV